MQQTGIQTDLSLHDHYADRTTAAARCRGVARYRPSRGAQILLLRVRRAYSRGGIVCWASWLSRLRIDHLTDICCAGALSREWIGCNLRRNQLRLLAAAALRKRSLDTLYTFHPQYRRILGNSNLRDEKPHRSWHHSAFSRVREQIRPSPRRARMKQKKSNSKRV